MRQEHGNERSTILFRKSRFSVEFAKTVFGDVCRGAVGFA
jgi:hypothetical protein